MDMGQISSHSLHVVQKYMAWMKSSERGRSRATNVRRTRNRPPAKKLSAPLAAYVGHSSRHIEQLEHFLINLSAANSRNFACLYTWGADFCLTVIEESPPNHLFH